MPITRRTEPMTEEDRSTVRTVYSRPLGGPGCLPYLLVVLLSVIGSVVAMATSDRYGLAPMVVLAGLIAASVIAINVARIPRQRRHKEESALRLEAALARGTMVLVEIVADAAWWDEGNDDSPAILLRVAPGRFAYVSDWPCDLPTFKEGKVTHFPSRVTLRMLDEDSSGLSVHGEGDNLDLRDDIMELPVADREWPEMLKKPENFGTQFLELSEDDLPASWRPIVRRP